MHGHRVELGATEVITPVKRLWWNLVRVRLGVRLGLGLGLGVGLEALVQGRRTLTMCIPPDLGRHQSAAHIVSIVIVSIVIVSIAIVSYSHSK